MPALTRLALVALLAALAGPAYAQTAATPALRGSVRDISGAVMQAVTVRATDESGARVLLETTTGVDGGFVVVLPPGRYRLEVTAQGFAPFTRIVALPAREPLEIVLDLDAIEVALDVVPDDELTANPVVSLTATTLAGDELLDLPRDQEELAEYLMLIAGADSSGAIDQDVLANFIVDGFADGRLPRPDQISQIIIDPNPMSAGGRGGPRIEIVTRPGSGRWHRSVDLAFADESLNARTPGEARKEARQRRDVGFEIEGPVIPDVFDVSLQVSTETDERAGDSLRAITPVGHVFQGVVQPQQEREFEVTAQVQLNLAHRLDARFTRGTERAANGGIGGFSLPERASDERSSEWTLRIGERMFRENLTNNVRFEIGRSASRTTPVHGGVAIDVADAFSGGGGTNDSRDDDLAVRLDNDLRWQRGDWSFEWGGRLQYVSRRSVDRENYNGTFEFASLHDYCHATAFAGVNCAETERIVDEAFGLGLTPAYTDARGRLVEITGVPVTYTQAFGNPEVAFSELAFNTHLQADRRFGRAASLRLGLAYDATNHSRDFVRLNPTANFQYRLTEDTVVSAGARLAFDDFRDYERLLRNDGSTYVTELFVSAPTFPDPFLGGIVETDEATASIWRLDSGYRPPYSVNPQLTLTQQIPGNVRMTLTYSGGYGFRQRRTRNANAPYPGTPLPEDLLALPSAERRAIVDRMRPMYPYVGNVTQIESTGRSESRTVRLRAQPRGRLEVAGVAVSGDVSYTYRAAWDDNDFNNPYVPEWGPARRDHQLQSRFRIGMPTDVPFANPMLRALARLTYERANFNFSFRANTGRLYSIRTGRDLNGDQSTRDRPAGVARNSEVGPARWNLDMTFTKDYPLGPAVDSDREESGAEAGRRGRGRGGAPDGPRLRFQARVNNLLNRAQPRAYGSVLTSPLFGLPTGYTGGRAVNLSMSIDF